MCLMALSLIGTAVSAAGSIAQGNQAAAAAEAQAAAIEQQAEAERRASAYEALQTSRKQELQQSAARASIGASGVGFAGSPTAVLVANAGQGQLDLEAIRFGSTLKQNNLGTQADLSRMQGRQAKAAGAIGAVSSFINGATNAVRMNQNPFQ